VISVTLTEKAPGSATATATGSFTVNKSTPRSILMDTLASLSDLKKSATADKDTDKLGQAIDKLNQALDPALWLDDFHPNSKGGEKVFDRLKDAIGKLSQISNDKNSTVSKSVLLADLNSIAQVAGQLASIAISDATSAKGKPGEISTANDELKKALSDLNAGKFNSALEHFKNAWQHAEHAVRG